MLQTGQLWASLVSPSADVVLEFAKRLDHFLFAARHQTAHGGNTALLDPLT